MDDGRPWTKGGGGRLKTNTALPAARPLRLLGENFMRCFGEERN